MGAFLRRGSNVYYLKRQIEGRRFYRSLHVRKGQESLLSARIAQVDEQITAERYGLPSPTLTGSITLTEFIPIYGRRKAGKASLDRDLYRLRLAAEIMGDKPLPSYRHDAFEKLEGQLEKRGRSRATINRYLQALHHAFDIAQIDKYIRENPLAKHEYFVEDKRGGRDLTEDEIRKLLVALKALRDTQRGHGPRGRCNTDLLRIVLYDMARFGLYTGARLGEVINLRHDQTSGDVATYQITETKFRKRGQQPTTKERRIYLPAPALAIVAAQPKTADGYVFSLPVRTQNFVSRFISRNRESWGIPRFTFHWLRHTFVSKAIKRSEPALVQSLVGHADIQTTMKYTHPHDARKRKIAAKVGAGFSKLSPSD